MRASMLLLPLLLASCSGDVLIFGEGGSDPVPLAGSSEGGSAGYLYLLSDDPCTDPCTFRASSNMMGLAKVRYMADEWVLGESTAADDRWAFTYDFNSLGDRYIKAIGFDASGAVLNAAGAWIEVVGDEDEVEEQEPSSEPTRGELPDVPYFYQYSNAYSPSSSCQNTSLAMVLSWLGWNGDPDDITGYWGTSYAQTPAGLAALFNTEASWAGLPDRMRAHTAGTISGMKALLDDGLPVIIHGYFTSYGHVVVVLGYDSTGYWVNDPAGTWNERFMGGYPYGWEPTAGHAIHYDAGAFEAAVATSDGTTYLPLWYHELY
jgi:uncharacterized protein YvpB